MRNEIDNQIIEAFRPILEVESIYLLDRESHLALLVVVQENSPEVSDQIAEQELILVYTLPHLSFDFNTISRRQRSMEELVGNYIPFWKRQEERIQ